MDNSEILSELQRSLGRIEGKQDMILSNHGDLKESHEALRSKVSAVERRLNWYSGSIAGLSAVAFLFKDRLVHLFAGV